MAQVRWLYTNAFTLAGLTLLVAGPTGHAQQFVLFDATFTFTKEDADNSKPSKSHYYVRDKDAQRRSAQGLDEPSRLPEWHRPHPGRGDRETGGRRHPRPGRCATSRTRG